MSTSEKTIEEIFEPRRIIVCGGRDYCGDVSIAMGVLVASAERKMPGLYTIVTGGADGADTLAEKWAIDNGLQVERYPAEWGKYGRSAGPRRNRVMAALPAVVAVLVFPGGRGTNDMINAAKEKGLLVFKAKEIEDDPWVENHGRRLVDGA
jgi:predicted Rossmann fold nucleotide-binding protein DprA/Smf involved in DNA uptake